MRHWTFFGPGDENTWYGTVASKPNGDWKRTAENIVLNFAESGHLVFRGTSPLARGAFKSKGAGKVSLHINAETPTAEMLFRTVLAANQLSISSVHTEQ